MATFFFTVRGDQIGQYTSISGTGNGADRVVTLQGVTALDDPSVLFTIRIDQAQTNETQFRNGQILSVFDQDGNQIISPSSVQPDIEQGLGAGDEHLIFQQNNLIIDLRGVIDPDNPGTLVFTNDDETADPGLGDNDGELDFEDVVADFGGFPCIEATTLVETIGGHVAASDIRAGDLVMTRDNGPQAVLWAGVRTLTFPGAREDQIPVLMPRRGRDGQMQDLILSPQHRVLISTTEGEAIVPAKALLRQRGVRLMKGRRKVTYVTLLTRQHQIIAANGVWVETFYPGPIALGYLSPEQRSDLTSAVPGLTRATAESYGPTARPVARVKHILHAPTNGIRVMTADPVPA